jgi:hypothetical protein
LDLIIRVDAGLRSVDDEGAWDFILSHQAGKSGVTRRFRFEQGVIAEMIAGSWLEVPPEFAGGHLANSRLEVRVARRLLGDILTQDGWLLAVRYTSPDGSSHGRPYLLVAAHGATPDAKRSICTHRELSGGDAKTLLVSHHIKSDEALPLLSAVYTAVDAAASLGGPWPLQLMIVGSTTDLSDLSYDGGQPVSEFAPFVLNHTQVREGESLDDRRRRIYQEVLFKWVRLRLEMNGQHLPAWAADMVAGAVRADLVRSRLGWSDWLALVREQSRSLIAQSGSLEPVANVTSVDPSRSIFVGSALSVLADAQALLAAWDEVALGDRALPFDAAYAAALERRSTEQGQTLSRAQIEALWSGWINQGEFNEGWSPSELVDVDADGLPNWLERLMGTDPRSRGAGMRGEASLVASRFGEAHSQDGLVADNSFDDWLQLIPQRINIDRRQSGSCSSASNVTHFAAVASEQGLFVGAVARSFSEQSGRWELAVDLAGKGRQWLVSTLGDELIIQDGDTVIRSLTRGLPWRASVIEWLLPWEVFGTEFNQLMGDPQPEKIQLLLRTSMPGEGYCDETGWFGWADGRNSG